MTKAEAIELLDNLIGMVEDNQENDYDAALKMAGIMHTIMQNVKCLKFSHGCRCQSRTEGVIPDGT